VTPTGVTVPVAGESIAMTIMREYIAKSPDFCTEKAMMAQVSLLKLTFINVARDRGTCGSRKFEFRKNIKYAAGTPPRHPQLPVGGLSRGVAT
jgi:hypothetical protein